MSIENMSPKVLDFILRDFREGIPLHVIANTWGYSFGEINALYQKYQYFRSVWKPFKQASWDEDR